MEKQLEFGQNKNPKISVITVCFNASSCIEKTLKSVINQTYNNIEYIVIDGASKDDTNDIIKNYQNRISFYVSEPDKGVYDAMNKGVLKATGDYVIMMNAGDTFVENDTIRKAVKLFPKKADIIFGDSIEKDNQGSLFYVECPSNPELLSIRPTYRHGASFVKTDVHKQILFDLDKKSIFDYGLDYNQIWNMHNQGYTFQKINLALMIYEREGMSANPLKSAKIIFNVIHQNRKPTCKEKILFNLSQIKIRVSESFLRKPAKLIYSFMSYLMNYPVGNFPWWKFRKAYFKMMGVKIDKTSILNMHQYFLKPNKLTIGKHTHINRGVLLDARGGLKIGNNVSISYNVSILTGSHDVSKSNFPGIYLPIVIEDYVWIGANATILNDVRIGEGAIVASGAVVNKDIEPYTVVGGIPAKKIGDRNKDLDYKCEWGVPFC